MDTSLSDLQVRRRIMHMHVRRLEKLPLGALREHERRRGGKR